VNGRYVRPRLSRQQREGFARAVGHGPS
jgi:hypothetical protein